MRRLDSRTAIETYTDYLISCGYKNQTIRSRKYMLKPFFKYLRGEKNIRDLRDVTLSCIKSYCKYLSGYQSQRTDKPLSQHTKILHLGAIRSLFKALYIKDLIISSPVEGYYLHPATSKARHILSEKQISTLLDSIDLQEKYGLRYRTVFELIYSSGLRVSEASRIEITDIDFDNRMLHIRNSKFGKDRIVPVSDVAIKFLHLFCGKRKKGYVFRSGKSHIAGNTISKRFRELLKEKGLYKEGLSVHSIRHSTATHLLEKGAPLRYVQELLGHQSIETTVIYTHMLPVSMKRIYRSYHPRENGFYKEVDTAYYRRIYEFKQRLIKQNQIRDRERVYKKRWYEKQKLKKGLKEM
ncbi:MAG: tyrosine-type recombinase/integrase [Spirochaetes bacterium]|nr:tyrosine-type recombinase/integrase [Spirochaetota bacterium]